jgi:hypothetical protein
MLDPRLNCIINGERIQFGGPGGAVSSASKKIENATNSTKPPIHARLKISPFMKFVIFVAAF